MNQLNDKQFFDAYRHEFGQLTQSIVDALNSLLPLLKSDSRFPDSDVGRQQLAYCLATFKWETAHTMRPIDEYGSQDYFNSRYGPQTSVGKVLGNSQPGDGARFHGRGYVQLTGRNNYKRAAKLTGVDLISNPERAKDPAVAYQIAVQGMKDGWFTGKTLNQYIQPGKAPDFKGARRIINGQDKAQEIADLAHRFDKVLLAACAKA